MSSTMFPSGASTFRFVRPSLIANGHAPDTDEYILKQVNILSRLFSKKFLESKKGGPGIPLAEFFRERSLESQIQKIDANENVAAVSFEELLDLKEQTGIYYKVSEMLKENRLSFNTIRLLENKPLAAYLFARAKYLHDLDSAPAIYKFMTNEHEGGGIRLLYDFIVNLAAIDLIDKEKLEIGKETPEEFVKRLNLSKHNFSFSKDVFTPKVRKLVTNRIFNGDYLDIIDKVKDKLKIKDADIPPLVNFMKNSKIEITKDNAELYLPIALSEIKNSMISYSSQGPTDTDGFDFSVQYYDDEKSTLVYNKESVLCAAQLYYVMTLGDELDIFNTVNIILSKHLPAGDVDITSKELLNDLQTYVFNDSFRDLKDGTLFNRTQPEERRMFYRQVFNAGDAETVEGMALNSDFNVLWGTLMEKTVEYISKVERSENPEFFVSRQPIFQALEDIQYNLSTHCTGMAKVAAPVINKELDFVVQRILMNEEIRRQLAPNGNASFWKVIENVQRGQHGEVPNVAALRNKAVFGHKILSIIAEYTPELLDNDVEFGKFISTVEAYIIANSQLEAAMDPGSGWREESSDKYEKMAPSEAGAAEDEWDF
ncbi:MAG TPA: hypothetical protein VGC29_08330 [Flavisolibacter sp.]